MRGTFCRAWSPSWLLGVAVAVWGGGAGAEPPAKQEAWRAYVPGRSVALLTGPGDLQSVQQKFAGAMRDLRLELAGDFDAYQSFFSLSGIELSDRRLVVGLAAPEGAAGSEPFFFALVPTKSFEKIVASLGGEITGDVGVATLANFNVDLCLAPCGEWVLVTEIAHLDAVQGVLAKNRGARGPTEASKSHLALELSSMGLAYLADRADAVPPTVRRRALHNGIIWPPTLASLDAALLQNEHLIARWRTLFDDLELRAAIAEEGRLHTRLSGTLQGGSLPNEAPAPSGETSVPSRAALFPPAATEKAIWRMQGAGDVPIAELLRRLLHGYQQGRSDEMEVDIYPAAEFAEFESATPPLLAEIAWLDAFATQHTGDEPLYSNQAVLLSLHDVEAFSTALQTVIGRWNALMKASPTKTAVIFTEQPLDREGYTGLEFGVDMVEVVGGERTKEMEQLMARFFGPKGQYAIRLIPLGADSQGAARALLTDMPWDAAKELAAQVRDAPQVQTQPVDASAWTATLCPTRYLAWQNRVRRVMQDRTGDVPEETSPPEWISVKLAIDDGVFEINATAPRATLQAVGESLQGK